MDYPKRHRMSRGNSQIMDEMMDPGRGQRMSMRHSQIMEEMMDPGRGQRMSMRNPQTIDELKPLQRQVSRKSIPPPIPEIDHTKHSCTDVHCLIIFVCCIVFWFYIAHFAFTQGDLNKVLIPTDSHNRKCGVDSGVTHKPYLYFFDFDKCLDPEAALNGCKTKQVCVEQCPQESFIWDDQVDDRELERVQKLLICDDGVNKNLLKTRNQISTAVSSGQCSGMYIKSKKPTFNHCIPVSNGDLCNIIPSFLTSRKRRDLSDDIIDRFDKFKKHTAEFCRKDNATEELLQKYKSKYSQMDLKKIIAAIIMKFSGNTDTLNNEQLAEDIKKDLKSSWKVILMSIGIHVVLAVVFIALLRWLAKPLVWFSILGVLVGLIAALVYGVNQHNYYSQYPRPPQHDVNLVARLQNIVHSADFWMWVNVLTGAVLTIVVLIVVVLRKRIGVAVSLIKEASKAITSIKSTIFFPIFPGILYILVSILCGIVALYLNTIGTNSFRLFAVKDLQENCECEGPAIGYKMNQECDPHIFETNCHIANTTNRCVETLCSFAEIVKTPKAQWFFYFCVFTYFWVICFISAYGEMVLACAFSMWYWTFDKKKLPTTPLLTAVGNVTLYHLGTIAFGSLILAICRMIRYLLEMIEKRLNMYNNKLTQALMCCMKGCFCLLENFLRFLNRNAYITCAIHSTSFCASSQKAFTLITQNMLRMFAIDKVSDFLFFLSKLLLTASTCCATYMVLTAYPKVFVINYPLVPIILVACLGYIMSEVIFNTYGMAVDTLFFCFLEDNDENDGSVEKPYYMSKNLRKLLNKKSAMKKAKQIRGDFIRK
ncbi:choline transporter-like 2 [Musca autumnalis]|uniref:choline transporter-like 2 n=1 Tax=Musca autumnalis TaxID=221902 RepID=UPI003CF61717